MSPAFRSADEVVALIENILEASTEYSIIATDLNGTILLWNAGAQLRYGYSAVEAIGETKHLLHTRRDVEASKPEEMMAAALRLGKWEDTVTRVRKDGTTFPARLVLTTRRNRTGEPIGFLLISKDISEEQKTERLAEINATLEAASLAKDRFLAGMSHELRTPLNAIIGFTGTVLMRLPGPLNDEQVKQLSTVRSSARHLLSIINDMLDVAKIESGKIELSLEPVGCRAVLAEVVESLGTLAASKGLELRVEAPATDVVVRTDRRALYQIITNLTNNAIKFTDAGAVVLAVTGGEASDGGKVVLSVTDSGIGIRPEDQERLFTAFECIGEAKSRQEGTGLGLYISRELTELLGGSLSFDSEVGRGSAFSVELAGG